MQDTMLDALKALIRLELKVGELYEACALQWPEDAPFWLDVAREEAGHARAIERMVLLISKNPALYAPARTIRMAAIDTVMAGIDRVLQQLRVGQVIKRTALTIALDLENSLMEKRLHDLVQTDDPAFLQLRHDVTEQTREHRERFAKRLAALNA